MRFICLALSLSLSFFVWPILLLWLQTIVILLPTTTTTTDDASHGTNEKCLGQTGRNFGTSRYRQATYLNGSNMAQGHCDGLCSHESSVDRVVGWQPQTGTGHRPGTHGTAFHSRRNSSHCGGGGRGGLTSPNEKDHKKGGVMQRTVSYCTVHFYLSRYKYLIVTTFYHHECSHSGLHNAFVVYCRIVTIYKSMAGP